MIGAAKRMGLEINKGDDQIYRVKSNGKNSNKVNLIIQGGSKGVNVKRNLKKLKILYIYSETLINNKIEESCEINLGIGMVGRKFFSSKQ